jgi:hypothetical protein
VCIAAQRADLKKQLDIPATIKEIVGADKEAAYLDSLDKMSEDAFDDQCTGANPRCVLPACVRAPCLPQPSTPLTHLRCPPCCVACSYPLIKDLRIIYESAWTSPILPLAHLQGYVPAHHGAAKREEGSTLL